MPALVLFPPPEPPAAPVGGKPGQLKVDGSVVSPWPDDVSFPFPAPDGASVIVDEEFIPDIDIGEFCPDGIAPPASVVAADEEPSPTPDAKGTGAGTGTVAVEGSPVAPGVAPPDAAGDVGVGVDMSVAPSVGPGAGCASYDESQISGEGNANTKNMADYKRYSRPKSRC